MEQLNRLQDWETEMERMKRIGKDVYRMRQELREHEFFSNLRCLIIIGFICVAWYSRAI